MNARLNGALKFAGWVLAGTVAMGLLLQKATEYKPTKPYAVAYTEGTENNPKIEALLKRAEKLLCAIPARESMKVEFPQFPFQVEIATEDRTFKAPGYGLSSGSATGRMTVLDKTTGQVLARRNGEARCTN